MKTGMKAASAPTILGGSDAQSFPLSLFFSLPFAHILKKFTQISLCARFGKSLAYLGVQNPDARGWWSVGYSFKAFGEHSDLAVSDAMIFSFSHPAGRR
ncbi:MAG: hypothetical protein ACLGQX_11350 [Acidobacteriota bacterium]|jgi:hypothetical protein